MAARAQREKRRAARTAYGRVSAPSSRPAARSRRASGNSSPAHTPAASRWTPSTAIATAVPGSTAAAWPDAAIGTSATAPSSTASPRAAGHAEVHEQECREQHEHTVTHQPDSSDLGLEEHPRERGGLEKSRGAPFE